MIKGFACKKTERLHETGQAHSRFRSFARQAKRKLAMLHAAAAYRDLTAPPGNRLEKLGGDRVGQSSIRINNQWRICFRWQDGDAYDVEICDYH
ncbi:MAG: type II toxin-antitoxin system RelE/ParE family toxin [Rhodobacteraceae bacterium]|nr:type II toxin-antitoxin system RelE/ParE family toxin [Paracoccaceae bacterium]